LDDIRPLADMFLSGGEVGVVAPSGPCSDDTLLKPKHLRARPGDEFHGAPVVLLVSQDTGSGAQLLVAALTGNGRAQAIGQRTAGGGGVRTVVPFDSGRGGLALTTGELLTPGGGKIVGVGVEPSITAPEDANGHDYALERAMEMLNAASTSP